MSNEPPKLPKNLSEELKKEEAESKPEANIWGQLRELKKRGLFKGEITEIVPKDFNITKSKHYYVVDDLRKRSIKCISCPISHGGILEAHLLTRYKLEDGVLYLDNIPQNEVPDDFDIDNH